MYKNLNRCSMCGCESEYSNKCPKCGCPTKKMNTILTFGKYKGNTEVASAAEIAKMSPEEYFHYQSLIDSADTEYAVEQYKMETKYNEGLKKGEKKGRAEEKLQTAKAMKNLGLPTETIVKVTGLPIEKIEKL